MGLDIVANGSSGPLSSFGVTPGGVTAYQTIGGKKYLLQYLPDSGGGTAGESGEYYAGENLYRLTDTTNPDAGGYVYDSSGNFKYWNPKKDIGGFGDMAKDFAIMGAVIAGGVYAAGAFGAAAPEAAIAPTSAGVSGTVSTAALDEAANIGAANALSDATYAGANFGAVATPVATGGVSLAGVAATAKSVGGAVSSGVSIASLFGGHKSGSPNAASGGSIFSRPAPAPAPKTAAIGQQSAGLQTQTGAQAAPQKGELNSLPIGSSYAPIAIAVLGTIVAILLIERANRG